MKIKYPAEAFALGMVLFSAGMKEACAWGQQRLAPAPFCWAFQLLVWKWNGEPGL